MPIKPPASRIIIEVERAMGDLRRGVPVIVTQGGQPLAQVMAAEYCAGKETTQEYPAATKLMKLAGLVPHVVAEPADAGQGWLHVSVEAVEEYPAALAAALTRISEATVPLQNGVTAQFIVFRPHFGHEEHLAVVVGNAAAQKAPLVRVHSSCLTGDIFNSLRCDCGTQLQSALRLMGEAGQGIVLYLNQEGRSIGIANKLRAYQLQDKGMDTVESNLALGFAPDERDFAIAAEMLRQLNIAEVTLLTNNPKKVEALKALGVKVTARQAILTPPTAENKGYLNTKAIKMGHLMNPEQEQG